MKLREYLAVDKIVRGFAQSAPANFGEVNFVRDTSSGHQRSGGRKSA